MPFSVGTDWDHVAVLLRNPGYDNSTPRNMTRVRIRLANAKDCAALAEMRYRFRAELGRTNESKPVFTRRCSSWMKKRLHQKSSSWRCWIAENGKHIIGHACVQLLEKMPNPVNEPEFHAYVTNCYVLPDIRSRGIGKKLLDKALSWCHTKKVDAVILWASPDSRSFYRRSGFNISADLFELRRRGGRPPRRRRLK